MTGNNKPVVVVTGASRGIGRSLALKFGSQGNRIVVNYRACETEAQTVVDEIRKQNGEAFPVRADVAKRTEVAAMIDETIKRWGRVDILVNNAGINRDGLLLRMSEQDWDDVLGVNLTGPFLCIRAVAPVMMKQRSGHIVSLASITGIRGREGQANYAAAKAGLIGLTKTAAKELGKFNIKVNAVLPGYIPTEMGKTVSEEMRERTTKENALGKLNDPRDVADFIHHLTTMRNVSGQVFNLDSRIL